MGRLTGPAMAGAVVLLTLGGCSKGDREMLWSLVPVETDAPVVKTFVGGEYHVEYAPQRNHNGHVRDAHFTYHVRNTTDRDMCVRIAFFPDQSGTPASTYGLADKSMAIPAGRRVAVAAIAVPMAGRDEAYIYHNSPDWAVSQIYNGC